MSDYTENKTPNLIINTLEDPSKLSEITVGENEIVLVPDETEEEIAKKQDKLVAGTNITLVDDPLTQTTLISSTAQESFFRGTFVDWNAVPTNIDNYIVDIHGSKTPKSTDFIVINDASNYVGDDSTFILNLNNIIFTRDGRNAWSISLTVGNSTTSVDYNPYDSRWVLVNLTQDQWVYLQYVAGAPGYWYVKADQDFYVDNILVPANTRAQVSCTSDAVGTKHYVSQIQGGAGLSGAWRFVYNVNSVWATDGKNGWIPQYQIENTLPIATPTVAGITKLYTDLGSNTDGAVDQATVTTALDTKQDTLTASTGIEIDENNNISTNNIVWKIWPSEQQ